MRDNFLLGHEPKRVNGGLFYTFICINTRINRIKINCVYFPPSYVVQKHNNKHVIK